METIEHSKLYSASDRQVQEVLCDPQRKTGIPDRLGILREVTGSASSGLPETLDQQMYAKGTEYVHMLLVIFA